MSSRPKEMRNGCWICKKWEEHFYWDHFEESKFRFIKVMEADFTQKMEFPQKFFKNFRVELIDVIALEASGGKLWEIGLCKEEDHFHCKGGWKKFIEENEIEEGYILIFEYAGDSRFLVRIFDKTGCGRAASNVADDDVGTKEKNSMDQTWQNFQNIDPSQIAYGRIGSSTICKQEFSEWQSYSNLETKIIVRSSHDTLKILEHRFASKESNCSFVKVIAQSNITKEPFMAIPTKFVKKHIPQKPYGITICNESSKKWFVNCSRRSLSWGFCGKSLVKFVRENEIRKGDACVFELKEKGNNMVMAMRILRAEEVCSILRESYF